MSKIEEVLKRDFEKYRIIFWYDDGGDLRDKFESLEINGVKKIVLDDNEFSLKYQMLKEEPESKFLVYSFKKQPRDEENWLIDLLLANKVFYADRAGLIASELKLGIEFKDEIERFKKFFNSQKRIEEFKNLLDENETKKSFRLKLIAATVKAEPKISSIILKLQKNRAKLLDELKKSEMIENLFDMLEESYNYTSKISFDDFTYKLLNSHFYYDIDKSKVPLNRDAAFLVRDWMDSKTYAKFYKDIAKETAKKLNIALVVDKLPFDKLLKCTTYEECEQALIVEIRNRVLDEKISANEIEDIVKSREHTFWFEDYKNLYNSMLYAAKLIDAVKNGSFLVDSFDGGVDGYAKVWHKVDMWYRKAVFYFRKAEFLNLIKDLQAKIEHIYINGFLRVLADNFGRYIKDYPLSKSARQRDFYKKKVLPFIQKNENIIVIISDALRYECGVELASRLSSMNRYDANIEPMVCSLPSYTQLGMASLLPHSRLEISNSDDGVYVDGQLSRGMDNRAKILQRAYENSIAISDEEFLNFSVNEGREFVKKYKVIYIFHNEIDSTGDKESSEEKVFDAVESSFETIIRLIKQANNFNRSNIFITSDHGFLYHNSPVQESELCKYEDLNKPVKLARRFIIGKNLQETNCITKFKASELGVECENDIALVNSINRLRFQGGGNRFVHGGAALQELIIPLLSIKKRRVNDIKDVEVEVMPLPKITTNSISVSFYQKEPVSEKVKPVTLKIGFYSKNGELLTESRTITFDSTEESSRNREKRVKFDFKQIASRHNREKVVLKLKKILENSSEESLYLETETELNIAFFNEFDEF